MKPIALMIALLIGQPLLAADKKPQVVPNSAEVKAAIERDIRQLANKPTGELTKADLESATRLKLESNQLTDVSLPTFSDPYVLSNGKHFNGPSAGFNGCGNGRQPFSLMATPCSS